MQESANTMPFSNRIAQFDEHYNQRQQKRLFVQEGTLWKSRLHLTQNEEKMNDQTQFKDCHAEIMQKHKTSACKFS